MDSDKITDLQWDIAHYEARLRTVQSDIDVKRAEKYQLEAHIEKVNTDLQSLSAQRDEQTGKKDELEAQVRLVTDRLTIVKSELQQNESELTRIKNSMDSEVEVHRNITNKEIELISAEKAQKQNELNDVMLSLENAKNATALSTNRNNDLSILISEAEWKINEKNEELSRIVESIELMKNDKKNIFDTLTQENQSLTDKNTVLKTENASLIEKNNESQEELKRTQSTISALLQKEKDIEKREREVDIKLARAEKLYADAGVPLPA